jgi:uncharacterized membrane protein YGL010W
MEVRAADAARLDVDRDLALYRRRDGKIDRFERALPGSGRAEEAHGPHGKTILGGVKRIDALLADYADAHRTSGNVLCHGIGIPLIVFGTLSMLHAVPVAGTVTASEVLVAAAAAWYFWLDAALGAAMLVTAALLDLLARLVGDWRVGLAAFVVGWVFQGIGHGVYEKKSPAFLRNLVHLLVGPAYLVNKAVSLRRVSR